MPLLAAGFGIDFLNHLAYLAGNKVTGDGKVEGGAMSFPTVRRFVRTLAGMVWGHTGVGFLGLSADMVEQVPRGTERDGQESNRLRLLDICRISQCIDDRFW